MRLGVGISPFLLGLAAGIVGHILWVRMHTA